MRERRIFTGRLALYIVGVVILFCVSLISVSWEVSDESTSPPWWAIVSSLIVFMGGSSILFLILRDILDLSPFGRADIEKHAVVTLADVLDESPETFKNHVAALRNCVATKLIDPDAERFNRYVADAEPDLMAHAAASIVTRRRRFITTWVVLMMCVVFVFANLYLASHTLDYWCHGHCGFRGTLKVDNSPFEWLLESLYHSIVTASTVGFGDLTPDAYSIPRVLAITEILIAVFFLTAGLNYAVALVTNANKPDDLKERFRRHLAQG